MLDNLPKGTGIKNDCIFHKDINHGMLYRTNIDTVKIY
mgnify:CR=1 FL=1